MNLPAALPAGFLAAPVSAADAGAPLRLCAVLRQPADPSSGALVSLGEEPDASRFLGCIVDAGGHPREWIEWSVQTVEPAGASSLGGTLNNLALDAAWTLRALALRDLAPRLFVETGWESNHPAPMFLDPAGGEPPATEPWELCRDDAALTAAGYPPFSGTLHRYLWTGSRAEPPRFVPIHPGAPGEETITAAFASSIPFNPAGGFLLAQTFMPLSLEAFCDALGGRAWPGLPQGRHTIPLDPVYQALRHIEEPETPSSHLFSARRGRSGRLLEVFHLKLHLLLEAVKTVRSLVAATQEPMLDFSAASFRVTLAHPASGLPFLWTARPVLVRPGTAVALTVPTAGEALRYFGPGPSGPTRYRPAEFGRAASGRCSVRLRKVNAAEAVEIEATLIAEENLPEASSDLLRLHLRVGDGVRVTLYGHLDPKEALTASETRIRTVPQVLPVEVAAALKAAEGTTVSGVSYELLPLLSSPCDLYALGVLAVRLLLVNDGNTLSSALDETLSLARQASGAGEAHGTLTERLGAYAQEDPRWSETLGPHRLLQGTPGPDLLPADLWWEALAAIVRCFPGVGPDSTCRDLGDAPSGALATVFDRLIRDLEVLTARTRSLVVIDWEQNREIRTAIQRAAGA